ncbi:MAG: winged helix-turn-helix domain-containing protein [Terricaulis sp.]
MPAIKLADEPDFSLALLKVSPSACRVFVNGQELRTEALTMSALVVLAKAAGATVTRDDLIAACWQGRVVSDDAVARTIAKVRALGRATGPAAFTVETLPKIGYRLLVADIPVATAAPSRGDAPPPRLPIKRFWIGAIGAMAAAAIGLLFVNGHPSRAHAYQQGAPQTATGPARQAGEVMDALMNLDVERMQIYLREGWQANWKIDAEGNTALHDLMMVCERYPTHNKGELVRIAQILVDAGADPTLKNYWGDTPLIIARARRYCGPNHPVVAYLRTVIESGPRQGDAFIQSASSTYGPDAADRRLAVLRRPRNERR